MDRKELDAGAPIRARLEKHLAGKSFQFNPDPEIVDSLLHALAKRKEKFGEEYCPCRIVTGDREKDASIICPCIYHEAEIDAEGYCHCHLFARI